MRVLMSWFGGLLAVVALAAAPASAQTTPRFTVSAGAAAQAGTQSFASVTTFPYFAETARLDGAYDVGEGVAFDLGVDVRTWRWLSVRAAVTRVNRSGGGATRGSFPHPFFFNVNRSGEWGSDALDRTELGVHLSAAVELIRRDRLGVSVFVGPSVIRFDQTVVERVDVVQSYPYNSIDARLATGNVSGSAVGYHAGVDASWYFTPRFGVGALVRFSDATRSDVRAGGSEPFDLAVGGVQGGAGIRLRF